MGALPSYIGEKCILQLPPLPASTNHSDYELLLLLALVPVLLVLVLVTAGVAYYKVSLTRKHSTPYLGLSLTWLLFAVYYQLQKGVGVLTYIGFYPKVAKP